MSNNNPFDVDDDKEEKPVTPKPEPAEPIEEDPETGNIEISTEAEDEEPKTESGRQERRRERGRIYREAEEAKAENERLRMEIVRSEAARAATEAAARYNARREEPGQNPLDKEIDRVVKQKRHLYEAYQAKAENLKPEELEQYRKDAQELNDLHDELKHRKFNDRSGIGRPQEDPQTAAIRAGLQLMYPDVMGNEEYKQYALLTYQQRRIGKPAGSEQEDIQEAMRLTRAKYGLKGSRPGPTNESRRMYAGSPAGSAGRMKESGNGKLVLDKETAKAAQRIADEQYAKVEKDPVKRLRMWAQKSGPAYLRLQQAKQKRA